MAAALTLARIPRGRDLLDVAGTHGRDRGDSDNRQNDADPPVPNVCRNHDGSLTVVPIEFEMVEQTLEKFLAHGFTKEVILKVGSNSD